MSEAEPDYEPQDGCNETVTTINIKKIYISHYKNTRHNPIDLCSLSFSQQPSNRAYPKPGNFVYILTHYSEIKKK